MWDQKKQWENRLGGVVVVVVVCCTLYCESEQGSLVTAVGARGVVNPVEDDE